MCESIEIRRSPLLASPQGGVDASSRKYRAATEADADGVVFLLVSIGKPPRPRCQRMPRNKFLLARPPLLAVMQGTYPKCGRLRNVAGRHIERTPTRPHLSGRHVLRRVVGPQLHGRGAGARSEACAAVSRRLSAAFETVQSARDADDVVPGTFHGELIRALLLIGEHEVLYDAARALARARRLIPNFEGDLVPRCRHDMCFSQYRIVDARVLDFLRKTRADVRQEDVCFPVSS